MESSPDEGGWCLRVRIVLDRHETNELFLAGDALISWPTEGLRPLGPGPLDRGSMFLSEIVARPDGLVLAYESEEQARRTAKIMDYQLRAALPEH